MRLRTATAGLLITGAAFGMAGCGDDVGLSSSADTPDPTTTEPIVIEIDDALGDASLEQLTEASEVVVVGKVVSVEDGVTIGEDDSLGYSVYTVTVDQSLVGQPDEQLTVAVTSSEDGRPLVMAGRAQPPSVGDSMLWFLQRIDPQFNRNGYVLVSELSGAIPTDVDNIVVDGETDHPEGQDHYHVAALREATQLGTASRLIAKVKQSRR